MAAGDFEALHELAEPVAVDVIHLRKVEQDLAIAFAEELFDEAGEEVVADSDGEAAFKIDDHDGAFFSGFDVHAGASYIGAYDLQRQLCGTRSELREPRDTRGHAIDFERVAAGR